jgi:hypothetical protein
VLSAIGASATRGKRFTVAVIRLMSRGLVFLLITLWGAGCAPSHTHREVTRAGLLESMRSVMEKYDVDGDGRLNQSEWETVANPRFRDVVSKERWRQWSARDFRIFDVNKDGYIDFRELSGPSLKGFDCLDRDHNGWLSLAEQEAWGVIDCPHFTIK